MPDTSELIKLLAVMSISLWLLLKEHNKALFVWLGIALATEIFDIDVIVNLSPFNVLGLLCLPLTLRALPSLLATRAGKLVGLSFLLLLILGFVYGYLLPWSDVTGIRPINQRAEGRSIIYLVRTISELSIAIYIATKVQSPENISKLLKGLLVGTSLAALGILLQWALNEDIYARLVPSAQTLSLEMYRLRGFNGEPRTSGQVLTWGILLLLGIPDLQLRRFVLLSLHVATLALTVSTTGLVSLAAGIGLLIVFSPLKRSTRFILLLLPLLLISASSRFTDTTLYESWDANVSSRVLVNRSFSYPMNTAEAVVGRLEVFDASAVLFLLDNPQHLIFGTGPGLVSLPASGYIPPYAQAIYGDRIDSVPHMGFFLLVANSGLVGLGLWWILFWTCYQALKKKASAMDQPNYWREGLTYYVVFSGLYFLQAQPVWYLFLGIGLGAVLSLHQNSSENMTSPISETKLLAKTPSIHPVHGRLAKYPNDQIRKFEVIVQKSR